MKCRHVSMFMMTVTLAYSAPIEYEYETIEVATTSKPLLQQADTPGKCCSDPSQRCCPYDYDDRCEITNNRTLCGYNKNQKNIDAKKISFTKFGLPCRINDDRVECGYNGPYITDVTEPLPNTPARNLSGCCNCCNKQTTIESTTFIPKPTETSSETTETGTESTESAENTGTTFKKLIYVSTTTEMSRPATTCVTVEEKCHIVYDQPCIMEPPCRNDYSD